MKKLGFLIAALLLSFTTSVHAASIHIPNLTSHDFTAWDPVTGPALTSSASIDVYFDNKADTNQDPFIYEFGNAFRKIDIHLNALVDGVWEDLSFSIDSPTGSGNFKRNETDLGWPTFLLSGPNFWAYIQTAEVDGGFTILDVAASIFNYEYLGTEAAYLDFSPTHVPEPGPIFIFILGVIGLLLSRIKSHR